MKKLFMIVLAVLITATTALSVFAGPGLFVNSPSENPVPTIVEYHNEDHECTAELVITPYSERDTLPQDARDIIEKAYEDIVKSKDLSELCAPVKELAEKAGVPVDSLAVSDLFDISYYDCELHPSHGKFFIKISADTLKNFVGLMCLADDGWMLITDAAVDEGEEYVTFTTSELSPFAVIVKTQNPPTQTGDDTANWIYFIIMMVSATALVFIAVAQRKKNSRKSFAE